MDLGTEGRFYGRFGQEAVRHRDGRREELEICGRWGQETLDILGKGTAGNGRRRRRRGVRTEACPKKYTDTQK